MNATRLSVLGTDHLYFPGNAPRNRFVWRLSWSQGHRATGKINSMNSLSDANGNRIR